MHRVSCWSLGLGCALALLLVGCGGDTKPRTPGLTSYVTPGIDFPIYAAMLTNETTQLVFVTDAQMIHATFRGESSPPDEPFSLATENDETLEMTPEGEGGYKGTFTAASGETYEVTLERVVHRNAGLYRGRENIFGEPWITNLIFLNDGKILGASRSVNTGAVERRTSLDLGSKWSDPTTDP